MGWLGGSAGRAGLVMDAVPRGYAGVGEGAAVER